MCARSFNPYNLRSTPVQAVRTGTAPLGGAVCLYDDDGLDLHSDNINSRPQQSGRVQKRIPGQKAF